MTGMNQFFFFTCLRKGGPPSTSLEFLYVEMSILDISTLTYYLFTFHQKFRFSHFVPQRIDSIHGGRSLMDYICSKPEKENLYLSTSH